MGRSLGPSSIYRTSPSRGFIALVTSTLLLLPLIASAELARPSRSEARNHARAAIQELHQQARLQESHGFRLSEESLQLIEALVMNWRAGDYSELPNAHTSIAQAPYPDLLLATRLPDIWAPFYESNYQEQRENLVANTSLEAIYDGFLEGFLNGSLPPGLLAQANQIGPCLASRAIAGRGPKCELDTSETVEKVPNSRLFWAKFSCGFIELRSYCGTRKLLYAALKPQLIEARKSNPELRAIIEAEFEKRFPSEFERLFKQELHETRQNLPTLISSKFDRATVHPLWSPRHRLIEPDRRGSSIVTLRGFARSLETEILTASLMANDADPRRRGLAAVAFYAAANRLLVLTGGEKGIWNSELNRFQWNSRAATPDPRLAPTLGLHPFGGVGIDLTDPSSTRFSPWNWESDSPRLLPSAWSSGAQNIPTLSTPQAVPVQNLHDLADLLSAVTQFLHVTRPGTGKLAPYFGPEEKAADLLDPSLPFIFPVEGRKLGVGVLAGVLKLLVDPSRGHLILKESNDPNFGLGLEFVEQVGLQGRTAHPTSTEAVARILLAAHLMRETLPGDPDVPTALLELLPQLDQVTQIGAIYLGAQAQTGSGNFRQYLGDQSSSTSRLIDTVLGLRALSAAWNKSEMLLQLVRVHAGWVALTQILQSPDFLVTTPPDVAWELLSLWRETQAKIRPRLNSEFTPVIPWDALEKRIQQLGATLREPTF